MFTTNNDARSNVRRNVRSFALALTTSLCFISLYCNVEGPFKIASGEALPSLHIWSKMEQQITSITERTVNEGLYLCETFPD